MKKLSLLNKIIYLVNNILALLLLLGILLPFISPKSFPILSVISLAVPLIIFTHILFILYWVLVGLKKQLFLSVVCVLLTIIFSYFPYKFFGNKNDINESLSVMSYNVHIFNVYGPLKKKDIPDKISKFVKENNPDIITFQEFANNKKDFSDLPYRYIESIGKRNFGQAIFSKYRIINKGSLEFENSSNNGIFVDLIIQKDTIRIYNIHLESFGLKISNVGLNEKDSKRLFRRLSTSFIKQQEQVEKFLEHKARCKYKFIICGDFNNTSYSWAYRKIKGNLQDSFLEAGSGFGKTYSFQNYPLRIDFILFDNNLKVNEHRNFNEKLSDHEPIMAKISK